MDRWIRIVNNYIQTKIEGDTDTAKFLIRALSFPTKGSMLQKISNILSTDTRDILDRRTSYIQSLATRTSYADPLQTNNPNFHT